ncbi:MAG: DUF3244 domain-containing protein [Bacteroidaceae bacterium]|nr:DUF3244 domain-containing protein [Bacteroidaceae bacterium]
MKTRKPFQWLMLAACLFIMGTIRVMADDKKDDAPSVPIPLITGDKAPENEARGTAVLPFIAYYQGGAIYISTSAEFSVITIKVENEATSQIWGCASDISDGMGEISIVNGGAGKYTVEIVTEYGECFTGNFRL